MARNGIYLARAREQIAQQRAENEREHRRRVDDAYRRVPGLRTLDQTLQQQMITLVGLTMRHGSDPTDELRALERANLDTQAQRAELLTAYHLPVNYTDDIYTCPRPTRAMCTGSRATVCCGATTPSSRATSAACSKTATNRLSTLT
ncbi:MAG: hypothetical protein ACLSDI_06300 [Oscillospiraceae bacterium]